MWMVCGVQLYTISAREQARVEVVLWWWWFGVGYTRIRYVLRCRLGLEQCLSCHVLEYIWATVR